LWGFFRSALTSAEPAVDRSLAQAADGCRFTLVLGQRDRRSVAPAGVEGAEMEGNSLTLADLLKFFGVMTMLIGVAAAGYLAFRFNQPGFASNGELTGFELLICGAVAFYHQLFGLLCLGVSRQVDLV
jgi:ABC-type amino acid transport substrate-binding protein